MRNSYSNALERRISALEDETVVLTSVVANWEILYSEVEEDSSVQRAFVTRAVEIFKSGLTLNREQSGEIAKWLNDVNNLKKGGIKWFFVTKVFMRHIKVKKLKRQTLYSTLLNYTKHFQICRGNYGL